MSDNWVVQNLQNALNVWNEKLSEIWTLITQSPQTFKGGAIWNVVTSIHGALQAIGYALLVLFFVIGMVKTCGSFAEVKKPEHAVKLFVRFAIAKGVITYGMELMMALLDIIQGVISTIMGAAGFGAPQETVLPNTIINAIEDCGFFESIPLCAVPLIGGLFSPGQGLFPRYTSGSYPIAPDKTMIVSRGIGNSKFPLRVNNRPEVVVIELRGKGN